MSQQQTLAGGNSPVVPDIEFLQGNTGGQVGPNPATFTINVLGDTAQGVSVNGNAGTYTETVTVQNATAAATSGTALKGVSSFNSAQFDVTSGYVSLLGGGQAIDSVNVDSNTAPGTDPVLPASDGSITVTGQLVAAGTVPVQTNSLAANTYAVQVQTSQALAATDATKVGLSNFDSTSFNVDANGFVTLVNSGFPEWTPFVVDSSGNAPYTTIQSALDAANTAGYKLVLVHYGAGNYVEDLTLYDQITVMGIQEDVDSPVPVLVTGTHTPPASGSVAFANLRMNDASAIVSSAAAISTRIAFINCSVGVTNGFTCDVTASTGTVSFQDCSFSGIDDGLVNNATGTAVINITNSSVGGGGQILATSGFLQSKGSSINCEASFAGAASVTLSDTVTAGMTFAGTSSLSVVGGRLAGAGKAAITQSSSGTMSLVNVAIDSNNNPSIDGAGAGVITLVGVPFLNNTVIAGTLTTAAYDWKPYGTAGTTGSAIRGTAAFDSNDFDVVAGFVDIKGSANGTGQTIGAVTADIITIPLGGTPGTFQFEARCKGFESTTPAGCGYNVFATLTTDGVTATLEGTQNIFNENAVLNSADAYFVASGNNAVLQVLGVAGLTINWTASSQET